MLTWEDDVEVHALRKRGWSISAIARHTGRDRKTVRAYLAGERTPGVRARPGPDSFEPFVDYVSARLREDPHLWAREMLVKVEDAEAGELHVPGLSIKFSKTPGTLGPVPVAGQHTDEILSKLPEYDQSKVDRLRADGVVQ